MTSVACCQLSPVLGELDANLDAAVAAVHDAVALGADLVVLPELATSGYCFCSKDEAARAALGEHDGRLDELADATAANDAVLVFGFAEIDADGELYNSAMVIAGRERTTYRKVHLWGDEPRWFQAGDRAAPVVSTRVGRLGVCICYDLEFPEYVRGIALEGAEVLAAPTNWPRSYRPDGEHPPELVNVMATARLNRMPIAVCDRSGTERSTQFTGASALVDRDGWIAAAVGAEGIVTGSISPGDGGGRWLSDRRPEVYSPLLVGSGGEINGMR